jgi:hypothetical protein
MVDGRGDFHYKRNVMLMTTGCAGTALPVVALRYLAIAMVRKHLYRRVSSRRSASGLT